MDVIGLLELLQHCLGNKQANRYPVLTLMEVEEQVFAFHQARNMTDHQYHDKFKDLTNTAWRLGSLIGMDKRRVDEILTKICADPKQVWPSEKKCAQEQAKQEYIALMFLMDSDRHRYGDLVNNIKKQVHLQIRDLPKDS